jgi:uncharacterized protein (DUF1330 family)
VDGGSRNVAITGQVKAERQMKYYFVGELDLKDTKWIPEYAEKVTRMVERHGGRYLARTSMAEKLEGEQSRAQVYLLIEWPSKQAAMTFLESEEYRPFREQRLTGTRSELVLIVGQDDTRQSSLEDCRAQAVSGSG